MLCVLCDEPAATRLFTPLSGSELVGPHSYPSSGMTSSSGVRQSPALAVYTIEDGYQAATEEISVYEQAAILPPYSVADSATTSSSRVRPNRSESMEYIISDSQLGSRQKLCCSSIACRTCITDCLQFKRVLLSLSTAVLCCTITSIALGIVGAHNSSYVTLSLMFAGMSMSMSMSTLGHVF